MNTIRLCVVFFSVVICVYTSLFFQVVLLRNLTSLSISRDVICNEETIFGVYMLFGMQECKVVYSNNSQSQHQPSVSSIDRESRKSRNNKSKKINIHDSIR